MPISEADDDLQERSAQHEADDIATVRAQRHAHADLAGAPLHGVGRDTVQADRGQYQREDAEHASHLRDRALLIELRVDLVLQASVPSAA